MFGLPTGDVTITTAGSLRGNSRMTAQRSLGAFRFHALKDQGSTSPQAISCAVGYRKARGRDLAVRPLRWARNKPFYIQVLLFRRLALAADVSQFCSSECCSRRQTGSRSHARDFASSALVMLAEGWGTVSSVMVGSAFGASCPLRGRDAF